ncbi:hypothetical protein AJ79_00171 [Helicocarpus griseus UAMH5409]|uniref:Uncharacterized protein n=1 Tax=Helicocarpus griseus UAMH5409 TaxID=1447875 RepID=A0A2B7YCX3_9EURO|nr:hypothetical protein AJ79_00171 [Helicocarpus griseus UAMH5409]
MANEPPIEPEANPSPWLINFEGGDAANKVGAPLSVRVQIENDKRELGLDKASPDKISANASHHPQESSSSQTYHSSGTTTPSPAPSLAPAILTNPFHAIAARAYQEAVRFPEQPPPAVWAPNDQLHTYYTQLLASFSAAFRNQLALHGHLAFMTETSFRAEWVKHSRSILDNIRAEWGQHPLGSTAAIKTTATNTVTTYNDLARYALHLVTEKPTEPPPEGWRWGEPLHQYYQDMLARFERVVGASAVGELGVDFRGEEEGWEWVVEEVRGYETLIIREYRRTWIEMFGL